MSRRSTIVLAAVGASVFLVAGAVVPRAGQAAPAPGGPSGAYAFSLSTHDAYNGQEGAGVGTMVFDAAGNVTGTISQTERFSPPCTTCGDLLVSHATYTGTYVLRADGSATLDICINQSPTVKAEFEGAFSNAFRSLRLVLTQVAAPCVSGTLGQVPNITSGMADKL